LNRGIPVATEEVRIMKVNRSSISSEDAYRFNITLKHILKTALIYGSDKEIVYRDRFRSDYQTFYNRVGKLANGLEAMGVKRGTTVAVLEWDSHRYLECFFAIPMMGATLHMVNVRLSPDQILYTMNHAEDEVVLFNSDFLPILESIADRLDTVKKYIMLTDSEEKPEAKFRIETEYEHLLRNLPSEYVFPELDEDTRATVFYTTGTTGLPKGVQFTHRQLVLHTLTVAIGLGSFASPCRFRSDDVYMPITPMFHVHAWGIPYVATLLGAKQVYPGRYEPEMLIKLISGEGVTFSHCVPTILHMIVNSPAKGKVDLSRWKVILGGAALPKGLAKSAGELGIEVVAGFGMSETCPVISIANLKEHMLNWGEGEKIDIIVKAGLPLPLVDAEIVDEEGHELPHDGASPGELVLRAPWITKEYFKDPERTKELWKDGWMYTGDVALIDEEGYISITDRIKDAIKTGGEWVSSLELESLISQHEAVSEAAVIGVVHEKWGERPLALVVVKPDYEGKVSEKTISKFLEGAVEEGRISKWVLPERIEFVESIPKTSVGKINKMLLREEYGKKS
jgi:fatty-acyl-CoA synthase